MAKKKKAATPTLWVAVWNKVWMIDRPGPEGTVRTFTVATTKEEAVLTMRNGLWWFDDIEDPGELQSIERLDIPISEVPPTVDVMLQCGGRFIIPQHRLTTSLKALIAHMLIAQ